MKLQDLPSDIDEIVALRSLFNRLRMYSRHTADCGWYEKERCECGLRQLLVEFEKHTVEAKLDALARDKMQGEEKK